MSETAYPSGARPTAGVRDYIDLLKPRVMSLVVFTAVVGLAAAPTQPGLGLSVLAILAIAAGAGASGALNMWYDADIDAVMKRTRSRPVPAGRVPASEAAAFGVVLSALSVTLLWLATNALAASLLAFTIFFYAVIYTMWLKRRTPQNIVIGGAAGAAPPMIGWAIATGEIGWPSVALFALIFLWTPPHSWALALFRRDDYAAVDVPMLPVVAGEAETRRQIWLYSLAMAAVSFTPAAFDVAGWLYVGVAAPLNLWLLRDAARVRRRSAEDAAADGYRAEKRFFGATIVYLFALFCALLAEAALKALG